MRSPRKWSPGRQHFPLDQRHHPWWLPEVLPSFWLDTCCVHGYWTPTPVHFTWCKATCESQSHLFYEGTIKGGYFLWQQGRFSFMILWYYAVAVCQHVARPFVIINLPCSQLVHFVHEHPSNVSFRKNSLSLRIILPWHQCRAEALTKLLHL